mgnify:CR=1 FL=1|jgi:hypothetical protein
MRIRFDRKAKLQTSQKQVSTIAKAQYWQGFKESTLENKFSKSVDTEIESRKMRASLRDEAAGNGNVL